MNVAKLFQRGGRFIPSGVFVLKLNENWVKVTSLQPVSFNPPWVAIALGTAIEEGVAFTAMLLRVGDDRKAPSQPALMELDCRVGSVSPVGDHSLVLATVEAVRFESGEPMISWRRAFHCIQLQYSFLGSRETLDGFVKQWETGTLPKSQWTHGAHIAVGAYYAVMDASSALTKTRDGIIRYNSAVGTPNTDTSGYHETLTRFWAGVLADAVRGIEDPLEGARHAVARYGEDRDLHTLFYAFDVVRSVEARRTWIAPDAI